jgi:hypothetical protein
MTATRALINEMSPTEAGAELLAVLREYLDEEDELPWELIYMNYRKIGRERGWPWLSEDALLDGLVWLGCTIGYRDQALRPEWKRVLRWSTSNKKLTRGVQLSLPLQIGKKAAH